MSVKTDCPNCGKHIKGGDKYAGKIITCPNCGKTVNMPSIPDSMAFTEPVPPPAPATPIATEVKFPEKIGIRQPVTVVVRDVDIPFVSMVALILKFWLGTLVAAILLGAVALAAMALLSAFGASP